MILLHSFLYQVADHSIQYNKHLCQNNKEVPTAYHIQIKIHQ